MFTSCRFTQKKLLKSGLKLIGGKTKTRDFLYQLKPANIYTYFEVFLGSGTILTGQDIHEKEFVSDLNNYVINFYQCMQTYPAGLWDELEKQIFLTKEGGRDYWIYLRDNPPGDNIGKAVWFYIITKACFNGIFRFNEKMECNSSFCGTTQGRGWFTKDWYFKVYDRVKDTKFMNCDYQILLDLASKYIPQDTWVVCDPPYLQANKDNPDGCVTTYNKIRFTDEDHAILAKKLDSAKYNWLLTINQDDYIKKLYKDFYFFENVVPYSCSQTAKGRGQVKEWVITNYQVKNLRNYTFEYKEVNNI